jgi:hypothetical protein
MTIPGETFSQSSSAWPRKSCVSGLVALRNPYLRRGNPRQPRPHRATATYIANACHSLRETAQHRIGRIVIGRESDAADVPLTIVFGSHQLEKFSVVTEELKLNDNVNPGMKLVSPRSGGGTGRSPSCLRPVCRTRQDLNFAYTSYTA